MHVLVVEDEPDLRAGLTDLLENAGYTVEAVGDGDAALERGLNPRVDVVLLDLTLPKRDGLTVSRDLRQRRPDVYILMLTARGSESDKVDGFTQGADDYLTKPFGTDELLARLGAVARRLRIIPSPPDVLTVDGCRLDLGRCHAHRDGSDIELTSRESAILRLLHRHRARAVTRSELLEEIWGLPGDLSTRTVDMTIANLRHKIEQDPRSPAIVVTIKGVGYAWGTVPEPAI